jgi:tetratricopeptide (TPR) repeat protein
VTSIVSSTLTVLIRRDETATVLASISLRNIQGQVLAEAVDIPVPFNSVRLYESTLDPVRYGQELARQLFQAPLQKIYHQARALATASGDRLRVQLALYPSAEDLHSIHWETLHDPQSHQPLVFHQHTLFSRTLANQEDEIINRPVVSALRALMLIANPSDGDMFGLAPVDVIGEVRATRAALGDATLTVVGQHPEAVAQRATLAAFAMALQERPHILYIICHGTPRDDSLYLWLERDDGTVDHISDQDLVAVLDASGARPALVVLAICHSASGGSLMPDTTLVRRLARLGIGAVVGFQGDVRMDSARRFVSALLFELCRDGSDGLIDQAVAAARATLRQTADWWQAMIWMRLPDGRIWSLDQAADERRRAALRRVRTVAIHDLLAGLVGNTVRLTLGLVERPDLTVRATAAAYQELRQASHSQAVIAPIDAIFRHADGPLLITGAPGAGKSILLLQLCAMLLGRAEESSHVPLPVFLNLASWAQRRAPLDQWLVAELASWYSLPAEYWRRWLDQGDLYILLDGLDEMAVRHRDDCVVAINAFLARRPAGIAIGVREQEYQMLQTHIQITRAVAVEPLRPDQIGDYLGAGGVSLSGLREAIARDADLASLASTPLMLSVLAKTYAERPADAVIGIKDPQALWKAYLDRTFTRRAVVHAPERDRTLRWFQWLASRMDVHSEIRFTPDSIQPFWLETTAQFRNYRYLSTCLAVFFVIIITLPVGIGFSLTRGVADPLLIIIPSAIMSFFTGRLFLILHIDEPTYAQTLNITWDKLPQMLHDAWKSLVGLRNRSLWIGLACGLPLVIPVVIMPVQLMSGIGWSDALVAIPGQVARLFGLSLIIVCGFGCLIGFLGGLMSEWEDDTIVSEHFPGRSRTRVVVANLFRSGLIFTSMLGLLWAGITMLATSFILPYSITVATMLTWAFRGLGIGGYLGLMLALLFCGGLELLLLISLRLTIWISGCAPLRLQTFLELASDRIVMVRSGNSYSFIHNLLLRHLSASNPQQGEPTMVQALSKRAAHLGYLGQYREAQRVFEEVIAAYERMGRPFLVDTISALLKLARIYVKQDDPAAARRQYDHAVTIWKQSDIGDHRDLAYDCMFLADALLEAGQYADVRVVIEPVLPMLERLLPAGDNRAVTTLANVYCTAGMASDYDGDAKSAYQHFTRSLEIFGSPKSDWGRAVISLCCSFLANINVADYQPDLAIESLSRSLESSQQIYGLTNPKLLGDMVLLARLYARQNDMHAAQHLYEEALAIANQYPTDEETQQYSGEITFHLGMIHRAIGNVVLASDLLQQTLAQWQSTRELEHPDLQFVREMLAELQVWREK